MPKAQCGLWSNQILRRLFNHFLDGQGLIKGEGSIFTYSTLLSNIVVCFFGLILLLQLYPTDYRTEKVEGALRESLKKLQLDYVDLYLIHLPTAFKVHLFHLIFPPLFYLWYFTGVVEWLNCYLNWSVEYQNMEQTAKTLLLVTTQLDELPKSENNHFLCCLTKMVVPLL